MSRDPRRVIENTKREIESDLDSFFTKFTSNLKATTPVDTGRAQRGWKKVASVNIDMSTQKMIDNRVDYIGVLDKGSSSQARDGVVVPSFEKTKRGL